MDKAILYCPDDFIGALSVGLFCCGPCVIIALSRATTGILECKASETSGLMVLGRLVCFPAVRLEFSLVLVIRAHLQDQGQHGAGEQTFRRVACRERERREDNDASSRTGTALSASLK